MSARRKLFVDDDEPVECNAEPVEYNAEPVECNAEPVEYNAEPVECNAEPVECNAEPVECNAEPVVCDDEPVDDGMEWADVTVIYEKVPEIFNAPQFRIRQTRRESSDSETEHAKPKNLKNKVKSTLLDIPPQVNVPSTSPMKTIHVKSPFPSDAAPPNHLYVYLDLIDGNSKYYVLTVDGMQPHYKTGKGRYLACASRVKMRCMALLIAPDIVVAFKWNLFRFNTGKNHTCHSLSESLRQWDGSNKVIGPGKLKVAEPLDAVDDLFKKLRID